MSAKTGQKTVLITGCSPGGIGHDLCKAFHARGLHVIATARNPSVLEAFADKPGYTCLQLDVTDEKSIVACRDEVVKVTGGNLDILVNNAGRTHTVPATDLDLDDVRATFETNVFGVMATIKHFIAPLISARGLIINVSSGSSVVPYPFASAYSSSKSAINAYSRTLRQELRPYGVRVMVTITGAVRSNINLQTDRVLPPDSLYQPIADVYQWRLTFSRTTPRSVTPEAYATRLVHDALKPDWPIWLRGIFGFGRPDWHYFGGMASVLYFGTLFGEWVGDIVTYRMFKLHLLENLLKKQTIEAKKSKDA